jgi:hypothetical protein
MNNHWEQYHNGDGGRTVTRQDEGLNALKDLRQDTTLTATNPTITMKPEVLSVLSCETGGSITAFVQRKEPGKIKQWSGSYSLADYYKLDNAQVQLEEFKSRFSLQRL